MSDQTEKLRRETLEHQLKSQLKTYQNQSAEDNVPHLRAAWFAVSMLLLVAVSLIVFAEGAEKLWGLLFAFGAAAIVIGLIVRYARIRRQMLRTQSALRALARTHAPQTPSYAFPSDQHSAPVSDAPQNTFSRNTANTSSEKPASSSSEKPANTAAAHKRRALHRIV